MKTYSVGFELENMKNSPRSNHDTRYISYMIDADNVVDAIKAGEDLLKREDFMHAWKTKRYTILEMPPEKTE